MDNPHLDPVETFSCPASSRRNITCAVPIALWFSKYAADKVSETGQRGRPRVLPGQCMWDLGLLSGSMQLTYVLICLPQSMAMAKGQTDRIRVRHFQEDGRKGHVWYQLWVFVLQ